MDYGFTVPKMWRIMSQPPSFFGFSNIFSMLFSSLATGMRSDCASGRLWPSGPCLPRLSMGVDFGAKKHPKKKVSELRTGIQPGRGMVLLKQQALGCK